MFSRPDANLISLLTLAVLAWSALTAGVSADELEEMEKAAGFVSMFNGEDFSGWRFTGDVQNPENWKVDEGVIKLSGGGKPHLATAEEYGDFEMRFQWRAMRENYNSGFFIRGAENLGKNQINLAKGNEGKFIGGKLEGAKAVPELQKRAGEWNDWRVLAVGEKVTFWCNDQLAWEATGLKPERGFIGLQAEGAPLEFRSLRIRPVK